MLQFIIFGTMGVPWTIQTGRFHCPRCGEQEFKLRQVRRFFTLYFIPLIPLDVIGRYVRCVHCATDYDESVLNYDPEAQKQEFIADIKRVMVLMAIADGELDAAETATIQSTFFEMTDQRLTEEEISHEAQLALQSGTDLTSYASNLASDLTDQGLVAVVKAAFDVASSGGTLTPGRQEQLMKLPGALGISQEDFKAIVDHFSQQ